MQNCVDRRAVRRLSLTPQVQGDWETAYEMARFSDGSIRWAFFNTTPAWNWNNSGGRAPLDTWTHVVVTYDGSVARTYINGVLVHAPAATGAIAAAASELRIGGRQLTDESEGDFRQNFDGRIDEVGIHNRALTAEEVSALYSAGSPEVAVAFAIGHVNGIVDGAAKPITVTTIPLVFR